MREAVFREQEPDPRSLSPAVEAVVADALESRTASLPVALARASAEAAVGDGTDDELPGIDAVSTAVASLSGYAHLRRELLAAPEREGRTVTLLASDYLHASAHAALGVAAVPPDRHRELYGTLTAGSADLARSLFATSAGHTAETDGEGGHASLVASKPRDDQPVVAALLAETGCALGAAVGIAPQETVEAMAAYGRSLVTAAGRSEGEEPLDRIEAAVAGTDENHAMDPTPAADGPTESHLERARTALETLPKGEARERLERATRVIGGRSSG